MTYFNIISTSNNIVSDSNAWRGLIFLSQVYLISDYSVLSVSRNYITFELYCWLEDNAYMGRFQVYVGFCFILKKIWNISCILSKMFIMLILFCFYSGSFYWDFQFLSSFSICYPCLKSYFGSPENLLFHLSFELLVWSKFWLGSFPVVRSNIIRDTGLQSIWYELTSMNT